MTTGSNIAGRTTFTKSKAQEKQFINEKGEQIATLLNSANDRMNETS